MSDLDYFFRTVEDSARGVATLEHLSTAVDGVVDQFAPAGVTIDDLADGDRFTWALHERQLVELLNRLVQHAQALSRDEPGKAMRVFQAVQRAVTLVRSDSNQAAIAFRIGYLLAQQRQFREAAENFLNAERRYRGEPGAEWQELTAATFAADAFNDSQLFEEGLAVAERLLARARHLGVRAAEVRALSACGVAQTGLGRDDAVENLQAALDMMRTLSEQDRVEYSTPDLSLFLSQLGTVARERGSFDVATRAFTELIERERERHATDREAFFTSELAYTLLATGERQRAARYLIRAADLADNAAATTTPDSRRWRLQASAINGTVRVAEIVVDSGPIENKMKAYELGVVSDVLTEHRDYARARGVAERVAAWALNEGDDTLQIGQLNNLATCELQLGHVDASISAYRRGIRLADGTRNPSASLALRQGLVHAYLAAQKNELAIDVLWSALAHGETLLAGTPSTEVRQQISATLLSLHEALASLLSQWGNHELMIGWTEMARSRNLLGWMRMASTVSGVAAGTDSSQRVLDELRSVEVELEVRQLAGNASARQVAAIAERRAVLRKTLDEQLAELGMPPIEWVVDGASLVRETKRLLLETLALGDAALSLFGVEEGICAAVVRAEEGDLSFDGDLIRWTRADRKAAVMSEEGHGAGSAAIQASLLTPLGDLLRRKPIHNLVVIPQAELALIPYWGLIETGMLSGSLCVSPSLSVYQMCVRHHRDSCGVTVVTPDITGSLPYSHVELRATRESRPGDLRECTTARQLLDAAPDAVVLHIAAHGVFNADNPYLGGVIVRDSDAGEEWSRQYVAAPRSFSSDPRPDAWPLMTVAECMAQLRLDRCRLAILSTCESGVPRLHGGGEMTGLPAALLLAGAQSVIASLWRVDDAATAVLMRHFYDAWSGGRGQIDGVAMALKEARRRLESSTIGEVVQLLGSVDGLEGDHPFADPFFTDAFQCFGAL